MDDIFLPNDSFLDDPMAKRLWEELVTSYNSYHNDSSVSKFFLPEELVLSCRCVAAAFTTTLYTPTLTTKQAFASKVYLLLLLACVCGVQLFIKERSLLTNFAPFKIATNEQATRAKEHAVFLLSINSHLPKPVDKVKHTFLHQLLSVQKRHKLEIPGKTYYQERFNALSESCIHWGYFFAQEMVLPYS